MKIKVKSGSIEIEYESDMDYVESNHKTVSLIVDKVKELIEKERED